MGLKKTVETASNNLNAVAALCGAIKSMMLGRQRSKRATPCPPPDSIIATSSLAPMRQLVY